jgi:hypothetical protein
VKSNVIFAFALATVTLVVVTAAIASPRQALRVDRPEKGAGAQITTVSLIRGRVVRRTRAVVLTDTRCNPDARGYSHCLNWMRLQNGRRVLAVHVHRMSEMPCLSPGEHVILRPVSS